MKNVIKVIAKCIVDNNLTEAQIVKELEFLIRLNNGLDESFVNQLDRNFNAKEVNNQMLYLKGTRTTRKIGRAHV